MATWAQVQAVTDQVNLQNADTDGVSEIYLLRDNSGLPQVYVYDVVADTLTALSTLDTGGAGVITGPVYFQNGLYCATYGNIYKYSGGGTTWSSVESLPNDANIEPRLGKSANHLVVVLKDINDANPMEVRYSGDGSIWSSGTVASTPSRPAGSYNGFFFNWLNPNNPALGLYGFDEDEFGASQPSSPSRYRLMKWDEGTTTLTTEFSYTQTSGGTPSGDSWILSYQFPDLLHWYLNVSANEYDTTLDGTFTAPTNSAVSPVRSAGFTQVSVGQSSPSTNLLFHQMVGAGEWDAGEVVDTDANAGTIKFVIRLDSGDVYILTQISNSSSFIYARDTPIDDGEAPATSGFYYGRGELQYRAALPFEVINIGGLAIPYPFAVLGSGAANAQMVAYAQPPNYASFTNFTGSLADDPIANFDSTPWGDAAAATESNEDSGPGGGLSNGKC